MIHIKMPTIAPKSDQKRALVLGTIPTAAKNNITERKTRFIGAVGPVGGNFLTTNATTAAKISATKATVADTRAGIQSRTLLSFTSARLATASIFPMIEFFCTGRAGVEFDSGFLIGAEILEFVAPADFRIDSTARESNTIAAQASNTSGQFFLTFNLTPNRGCLWHNKTAYLAALPTTQSYRRL